MLYFSQLSQLPPLQQHVRKFTNRINADSLTKLLPFDYKLELLISIRSLEFNLKSYRAVFVCNFGSVFLHRKCRPKLTKSLGFQDRVISRSDNLIPGFWLKMPYFVYLGEKIAKKITILFHWRFGLFFDQ